MDMKRTLEEIYTRLKAPAVVLEKAVEDKTLPKVFVKAALEELKKAQSLTKKLKSMMKT